MTKKTKTRRTEKKKLVVSTEKLRDLTKLPDDKLQDVAGGATCTGSKSGMRVC